MHDVLPALDENALLHRDGNAATGRHSSAAKDESLSDTLRVVSEYADIIGLRHYNDTTIFDDINVATVPVISCGFGNKTHPTQGLLDMYTAYRALGTFKGIRVMVTSPDLTRARSGQSFAMGLAQMGADIVYSSPSELKTPDDIMAKVKSGTGKVEEHFDLSEREQADQDLRSRLSARLLRSQGSGCARYLHEQG